MTPAAIGVNVLQTNGNIDVAATYTCTLINRSINFRFDGCHAVESPDLLFLFQSNYIRVLSCRPLLNYVLAGRVNNLRVSWYQYEE